MGSSRSLLLAITVGIIVAASAGGGYWWYRSTRGDLAVQAPEPGPQGIPIARPDEPYSLTLFMPANGQLEAASIAARRQPDLQLEAREAVAAILSGDRSQAAVLKDLHLRAFYLDPAGTAFVDLSPAGQKEVHASAWDELLAVYALVNTLTQNFSEIRQVRLLIDGREAQTLAGHVDLTRSFVRRQDLVKSP
jgi:flagellar basal body-associated protein FliL